LGANLTQQHPTSENMDDPQSYYERNKAARRAYQREYYLKNRNTILRKAQLRSELEPEKAAKAKKYQRKYYFENREAILLDKKQKYLAKKAVP
jgi:hypothetical protein